MSTTDFSDYQQQLEDEGFFVWRGLLPGTAIDEHMVGFLELNEQLGVSSGEDFRSYTSEKQAAIKRARYQFHREFVPTQRLIFNKDLIAFLRLNFGVEPVMRQPETGLYQRRTPVHTDSLDFKVAPVGAEVRIWCALEDINPEAGPVYFVPRSHKTIARSLEMKISSEHPDVIDVLKTQMSATTSKDYFAATAPLWRYIKDKALPAAIEATGSERRIPALKKGDAVIFSSDLVHGTAPCLRAGLTRKYFVAYWSARDAVWFHSRAFWGPKHDYRCPENAIHSQIYETPFGLRMCFEELHAAYEASFTRPVQTTQIEPQLLPACGITA